MTNFLQKTHYPSFEMKASDLLKIVEEYNWKKILLTFIKNTIVTVSVKTIEELEKNLRHYIGNGFRLSHLELEHGHYFPITYTAPSLKYREFENTRDYMTVSFSSENTISVLDVAPTYDQIKYLESKMIKTISNDNTKMSLVFVGFLILLGLAFLSPIAFFAWFPAAYLLHRYVLRLRSYNFSLRYDLK